MRKFHAVLLCFCCALAPVGFARVSVAAKQPHGPVIRGVVTDPNGKPAVGATVLIVSRDRITSAVSDRQGKFSIALANPRRGFG